MRIWEWIKSWWSKEAEVVYYNSLISSISQKVNKIRQVMVQQEKDRALRKDWVEEVKDVPFV